MARLCSQPESARSHRAFDWLMVERQACAALNSGAHERQRKDEARAAIGCIFGPDLAAVRLHNALADRQAEAGAAGMALRPDRAHKFLEDPREHALVNARPVIAHLDR